MKWIQKIKDFLFSKEPSTQAQATPDTYRDVEAQRTAEEHLMRAMLATDEEVKISELVRAASLGSGKARDMLLTEYGVESIPAKGDESYSSIRNEDRDKGLLKSTGNMAAPAKSNLEVNPQPGDWRRAFDIYWKWFKAEPSNKNEDELKRAVGIFDEEISRVMRECEYVTDEHHLALNLLVDYYQHRNLDRAFELTRFGAEHKNPTLSYLYGLTLKEIGSMEEAMEYMKAAQHGETTVLLAKLQLAVMYLEANDFLKYQDDALLCITSGIDIMDKNEEMRQGDNLLLYILLGDYYLKRSTLRNDNASYTQDRNNAITAYKNAFDVLSKIPSGNKFVRRAAEKLYELYLRDGDKEKAEFYKRSVGVRKSEN